jgi:hypothetical protein
MGRRNEHLFLVECQPGWQEFFAGSDGIAARLITHSAFAQLCQLIFLSIGPTLSRNKEAQRQPAINLHLVRINFSAQRCQQMLFETQKNNFYFFFDSSQSR